MFVTLHTLNELPIEAGKLREQYSKDKSEDTLQEYIRVVREFRKSFELPCWPYNDSDHMDHFKEFLRGLNVVYYDDGVAEDGDKNVSGPIYPYESEYYSSLKYPLEGFVHRVHLHRMTDDEDLLYTPMKWPYDDSQAGILMKDKIQKDQIMSDELAWGEMNGKTQIDDIAYGGFIKYKKVAWEGNSSVSQNFDTSRFSKKGKKIKQENIKGEWTDVG